MNKKALLLSLLLLSTTSHLRAIPNIEFDADPTSAAGIYFRASFNKAPDSQYANRNEVQTCFTEHQLREALQASPMFQAVKERGLLRDRFLEVFAPLEKRKESVLTQMETVQTSHGARRTKSRKLTHLNALMRELDGDLRSLRTQANNQPHKFLSDPNERNLLIAALLGHSYAPRKLVERFGDAYRPLLEFTLQIKSRNPEERLRDDHLVCYPHVHFYFSNNPLSALEQAELLAAQETIAPSDLSHVVQQLESLSCVTSPLFAADNFQKRSLKALLSLQEKHGMQGDHPLAQQFANTIDVAKLNLCRRNIEELLASRNYKVIPVVMANINVNPKDDYGWHTKSLFSLFTMLSAEIQKTGSYALAEALMDFFHGKSRSLPLDISSGSNQDNFSLGKFYLQLCKMHFEDLENSSFSEKLRTFQEMLFTPSPNDTVLADLASMYSADLLKMGNTYFQETKKSSLKKATAALDTALTLARLSNATNGPLSLKRADFPYHPEFLKLAFERVTHPAYWESYRHKEQFLETVLSYAGVCDDMTQKKYGLALQLLAQNSHLHDVLKGLLQKRKQKLDGLSCYDRERTSLSLEEITLAHLLGIPFSLTGSDQRILDSSLKKMMEEDLHPDIALKRHLPVVEAYLLQGQNHSDKNRSLSNDTYWALQLYVLQNAITSHYFIVLEENLAKNDGEGVASVVKDLTSILQSKAKDPTLRINLFKILGLRYEKLLALEGSLPYGSRIRDNLFMAMRALENLPSKRKLLPDEQLFYKNVALAMIVERKRQMEIAEKNNSPEGLDFYGHLALEYFRYSVLGTRYLNPQK